jgi:Mg-chelatase subunit ChlI
MRVVELPINASEDRVVGTIDIEAALRSGARKFEPGVLAEANRNILYVDEVNLLDDHLVDVLLDAAAMGVNVIEREGVSFSHPRASSSLLHEPGGGRAAASAARSVRAVS